MMLRNGFTRFGSADGITLFLNSPVTEMLQTSVYASVRPLGLWKRSPLQPRPLVQQVREAAAPARLAHVPGGDARREVAETPHVLCKNNKGTSLGPASSINCLLFLRQDSRGWCAKYTDLAPQHRRKLVWPSIRRIGQVIIMGPL